MLGAAWVGLGLAHALLIREIPDNGRLALCAIDAAIALHEPDSVLRLIEQRSGAIRGDRRHLLDSEELRARMLARSLATSRSASARVSSSRRNT